MASPVIKHSVVTGAAANPDVLVDGVAWDASHTVAGLESWLAAAGKPLVILFTGQSFLTQTPALVWAPETNVFVWDWNGTTGTVGTAFVTPSSTTINLATKFASDVARANPARTVYLINISFTGLAISHWLSGASSPDVFLNIQNNITSALAAAGATKIDLFGWVQGQADCVPLNTSYIANHATMMARFWADTTTGVSWFPKETPALIFSIQSVADSNSLNADADNMNMLLQAVADADPDRRKYIYLSSLTGSTYFDLTAHPTAQGHFAFGSMAAVEFLRGIGRSSLKNLAVDPATGYIMFGKSAYSPVPFVFNNNTAIAPANISAGGNLMQAVQADGLAGFNVIDTFGNFANFIGRRRNGTQQAPTTLALDDLIVGLGAIGFDGISDTTNKASLSLIAAEGWLPGSHGTYATLNITKPTTDTLISYRFESSGFTIPGTTSGGVKFAVPAVAGSNKITVPAGTTDFSATGGAHNFVAQSSAGAAFTVVQPAFTDISGSVAASQMPALTGEATTSAGAVAVTLTNSAVIGKVLTGYTSGAGTVASTDTILQAIQKLNGNDALKAPIASPTFTGTVTLPSGTVLGAVASGDLTNINAGTLPRARYAAVDLSAGNVNGGVTNKLPNASLQSGVSTPTATTSLTGVMMGLGASCALTPAYSGRFNIVFTGAMYNSVLANITTAQMRYGTGTAPTNGAAPTGTAGSQVQANAALANGSIPFTLPFTVTGLTVGTAYWFDICVIVSGGTGGLQNVSCSVIEF